MKTKSIFVCLYALLILTGGIIGYVLAGSLASLLSGVIFGSLLLGCSYFIGKNNLIAYDIILSILCCLIIFFCYRFVITHKIAPAGILFLITACMLIYLGRTRPIKPPSNI